MKNTHFCPSSDARTRRVCVLGKQLELKNYICSQDGVHYPPKPEQIKLQLTICPTAYCAAACPFCIATNTASRDCVDLKKLEGVLMRLKQEQLVRGVSISGGEPFTDVELLDRVITLVYEILGFDTEISVTTNGIQLHRIHEITHLEKLDALHISRHHYDDAINRSIFGIDVPTKEQLKTILHSVTYRDLFVLNCMLLKDYIGTAEQARAFLDFAIEVGAGKVAFIGCAPVNTFAREQALPYSQVLRQADPSLLFTRGFQDYEFCKCQDGVYVSAQGEIIEFYGRDTYADGCNYCRGFVYGADNYLRDGFNGNVII